MNRRLDTKTNDNAMTKTNHQHLHIEITTMAQYQSHHHNDQRWSSTSSSYTFHEDHDPVTPTITKQRRYTFSSLSSNDRCNSSSSPDKPIRCPLRRRSIDSHTSSISSSSSSNSRTNINNEIVPITPPMYISFESYQDNLTTTRKVDISNNKEVMPPKSTIRTTVDIVSDKHTINSSPPKKQTIMSTLQPIRCSIHENNTSNDKMNDDEIQAIKKMIMIMDDILCNNNHIVRIS